jgi:hypothetical protein
MASLRITEDTFSMAVVDEGVSVGVKLASRPSSRSTVNDKSRDRV